MDEAAIADAKLELRFWIKSLPRPSRPAPNACVAYAVEGQGIDGVVYSTAHGQARKSMIRQMERHGLRLEYHQVKVFRDEAADALLAYGQPPSECLVYDRSELSEQRQDWLLAHKSTAPQVRWPTLKSGFVVAAVFRSYRVMAALACRPNNETLPQDWLCAYSLAMEDFSCSLVSACSAIHHSPKYAVEGGRVAAAIRLTSCGLRLSRAQYSDVADWLAQPSKLFPGNEALPLWVARGRA